MTKVAMLLFLNWSLGCVHRTKHVIRANFYCRGWNVDNLIPGPLLGSFVGRGM